MARLDLLHPASEPEGLRRRIRTARNYLPLIIISVVLFYELVFVRLGGPTFELWARLLFYGGVGPLVTFFTVEWIAEGVRVRERAELELVSLSEELRRSLRRLDTVQQLIRQLAEARDLEEVLDAAVVGVVRATGAQSGVLRLLGGIERACDASGTLIPHDPASPQEAQAESWEVSLPLNVPEARLGSLSLRFDSVPGLETRSLLDALASEIATAIRSAQQRSRDLLSLYEVDRSIRAERNMDRLLERILDQMAERAGAQASAAYLVDEDDVLRLEFARDFGGQVWHGGPVSAFAKRVAAERRPLRINGPDESSVLSGSGTAVGLPMLQGDRLEGVLILAHRDTQALSDARLPLLGLLANQATLAVRNARAYLYSEELAIGEERNRIAREIHDGVAQSLAFSAIKLELVERLISKDPERASAEIQQIRQILREQIKEVRRSIFALRPIDLERYGLVETVRKYVQDFGEQNGLKAHLEIEGEVHLPPSDEAGLFRILQESLNNVAKHARASNVWVRLEGGEYATLTVRDDGVGFDPQAVSGRVSSAGGLGLGQMRERMESHGGRYRVESAPGQGTLVTAQLPQS